MRKELPGMYTSIRPSATGGVNRLAQNDRQAFVQNFLYTDGVRLYLPAVIVAPVKRKFNKVSLFFRHAQRYDVVGKLKRCNVERLLKLILTKIRVNGYTTNCRFSNRLTISIIFNSFFNPERA